MVLKVGWFVAILSILVAGISVAYSTQQQIKTNEIHSKKTKAQIAFSDQNWGASKKANLEILKHNPDDGNAWFMLALSRHYLGEYEESRQDYAQALALNQEPGIIHYNIACSYAREDNLEKVLEHTRLAIQYKFPVAEFAPTDPDLAEVRTNPEFKKVLDSTHQN